MTSVISASLLFVFLLVVTAKTLDWMFESQLQ